MQTSIFHCHGTNKAKTKIRLCIHFIYRYIYIYILIYMYKSNWTDQNVCTIKDSVLTMYCMHDMHRVMHAFMQPSDSGCMTDTIKSFSLSWNFFLWNISICLYRFSCLIYSQTVFNYLIQNGNQIYFKINNI